MQKPVEYCPVVLMTSSLSSLLMPGLKNSSVGTTQQLLLHGLQIKALIRSKDGKCSYRAAQRPSNSKYIDLSDLSEVVAVSRCRLHSADLNPPP
jgi:hypothetical protein